MMLIPTPNQKFIDMKALMKINENKAARKEKSNEANNTLNHLVYKYKRAISFELFSSKT